MDGTTYWLDGSYEETEPDADEKARQLEVLFLPDCSGTVTLLMASRPAGVPYTYLCRSSAAPLEERFQKCERNWQQKLCS
jgi:hypothetical protein